MAIILQQLEKKVQGDLELSINYYRLLVALSGVKLKPKELELLAFAGLKGNIYYPPVVEEFVERFSSSEGSVYNMAGRLCRLGIFEKAGNKMKVSPRYQVDFSKEKVKLEITLDKTT